MKTIFSGIQPSGVLHLGNHLGAIKQWIELQDTVDLSIFCVVDLHAITVPQDPKVLHDNILSVAAWYLAAGIDLKKSVIFVQSDRHEHAELSWLLNCNTSMGELSRMTQFKEKSEDKKDLVSAGLFDYPVLMAADILLYDATHVPVGEDQKQHVELARNLAGRFNTRYGETFVLPEPIIKSSSARIMGLDNPQKKMSKSAQSEYNYIALTDDAETIRRKIGRAVTDSGSEVKRGSDKPAINNLINIYSEVSGLSANEIEIKFNGKGYGDFKKDLAENIIAYLDPIQKRYHDLMKDKNALKEVLRNGALKLEDTAKKNISKAKNKIGLGIE